MILTLSDHIRIDLDSLRANFCSLRSRVALKGVLAVVKWNAYGHGLIECSKALDEEGCAGFGVSSPDEGIQLRKCGIAKPILVMTDWVGKPIKHLLDYDLACAATSWYKVEYLESISRQLGKPIATHLKFDTGLGRVGIHHSRAQETLERIARMKHLQIEAIYSHLAYSGPKDRERGLMQIEIFNRIIKLADSLGIHPKYTHLANSAAAVALPEVPGNLVRTGIALYGQPPSREVADLLPLEPVMTLYGKILSTRPLKKGQGYPTPHFFRAPYDGYGAEINLGYSTGYPRSIVNRANVLLKGKSCPLVGVMSKNTSYLFSRTKPELDSEVVFWGKQNGATLFLYELAPLIGALPYELTTWLTQRKPRRTLTE
jgi:alanine racemase